VKSCPVAALPPSPAETVAFILVALGTTLSTRHLYEAMSDGED
jgi:hypothetical protein